MKIKRRVSRSSEVAMVDKVSIRLPASDMRSISKAAQDEGKPLSTFIRDMLRQAVAA